MATDRTRLIMRYGGGVRLTAEFSPACGGGSTVESDQPTTRPRVTNRLPPRHPVYCFRYLHRYGFRRGRLPGA